MRRASAAGTASFGRGGAAPAAAAPSPRPSHASRRFVSRGSLTVLASPAWLERDTRYLRVLARDATRVGWTGGGVYSVVAHSLPSARSVSTERSSAPPFGVACCGLACRVAFIETRGRFARRTVQVRTGCSAVKHVSCHVGAGPALQPRDVLFSGLQPFVCLTVGRRETVVRCARTAEHARRTCGRAPEAARRFQASAAWRDA